jgi:mannose-6-phosphate isomerase-like protein (cupin superfamily)
MTFPEPEASWRPHAGTEAVSTNPGSLTRFVAPGSITGGEFGLFESVIPAGAGGATPHYHTGFSESFYVMSGQLAVMTGRTWRVGGSGDFLYVPPRGVHAFRSVGDEPTRFLILFAPGAPRERYFQGLAEFAARDVPPSLAEIDSFARECDQVNLRDWTSDPLQ